MCRQALLSSYILPYLEFILGLVDVDNQFIPLLFQIRTFQPHYITEDVFMCEGGGCV